jgi:hypothetical protein
MENNQTVLLSVNIDGRAMRLRVAKKDEKQVLLASELLNKRIDGFKRFGSTDPVDRLSWAALDLAGEIVRNPKHSNSANNSEETEKLIAELDSLLSNF